MTPRLLILVATVNTCSLPRTGGSNDVTLPCGEMTKPWLPIPVPLPQPGPVMQVPAIAFSSLMPMGVVVKLFPLMSNTVNVPCGESRKACPVPRKYPAANPSLLMLRAHPPTSVGNTVAVPLRGRAENGVGTGSEVHRAKPVMPPSLLMLSANDVGQPGGLNVVNAPSAFRTKLCTIGRKRRLLIVPRDGSARIDTLGKRLDAFWGIECFGSFPWCSAQSHAGLVARPRNIPRSFPLR